MKYHSTRNAKEKLNFSECLLKGLASDGGLFVPEHLPQLNVEDFKEHKSFPEFAYHFIQTFIQGDTLEAQLLEICKSSFNFELPIHSLKSGHQLVELYHGPTLAFKDFGARFLAACLEKLHQQKPGRTKLILVATSGDTGSAVASAFHKKAGCEVVILFPNQGVSPRQRAQLVGWKDNVRSFAVNGVFDDCQKMVKSAFQSQKINQLYDLTSANSINIGRLLPQAAYYAYISTHHPTGPCHFIVPTGNMGNVLGAFWSKACGFPIGEILLSTNANTTISEYFDSGQFTPHPSVKTLANAMDVGNPSNMERLLGLFEKHPELKKESRCQLVTDDEILYTLQKVHSEEEIYICPHTATAFYSANKAPQETSWHIMATAHPSKFPEVVTQALGQEPSLPPALKAFLSRDDDSSLIEPDLDSLISLITAHQN